MARPTAGRLRARGAAGVRAAESALLGLGAVAGVVCLLVALGVPTLGLRPLVVLSGSMAPTMPVGSLALARVVPADRVEVGDVVTVPLGEGSVTHRVVSLTRTHDGAGAATATLVLRGDANLVADRAVHDVARAPVTLLVVPRLGAVVAWLSRAPGVFVLAAYLAFLLGALRRPRPRRPSGPGGGDATEGTDPGPGTPAGRTAPVLARVTTVLVGLLAPWAGVPLAHAAWTDTVAAGTSALTSVTPVAPTVSCGVLSVGSTTIGWSAAAQATGYRVHYGSGGATTVDVGPGTLSRTFTGLTSGTFWVQSFYGSTTWISGASNSKAYTSVVGLLGTCL